MIHSPLDLHFLGSIMIFFLPMVTSCNQAPACSLLECTVPAQLKRKTCWVGSGSMAPFIPFLHYLWADNKHKVEGRWITRTIFPGYFLASCPVRKKTYGVLRRLVMVKPVPCYPSPQIEHLTHLRPALVRLLLASP